jgi:aryl-alcohol dehydrogenase-like predicted oxidoreductase
VGDAAQEFAESPSSPLSSIQANKERGVEYPLPVEGPRETLIRRRWIRARGVTVKHRRLGPKGPVVSILGLGCMGMSMAYGVPDPAEGVATIQRALDLGITFLDTADVYGPYTNEELVGRAIQGRREQVFLATKCGLVPGATGSARRVNGTSEYIRAACEGSLRRLGVDTIDLYYLHRVDPETPIEESAQALADLVHEGKVRYIGLSEVSASTLRRAHAVHPITAVQSEYSLWTRDVEESVLPTCRELGVGFVPFSPLGRGFFSGRVRTLEGLPTNDFRRGVPRFQGANLQANLALADKLAAVAQRKGCTAAQLALAWLLSRGDHVVPIPGAKQRTHLEENVSAADLQLSSSDLVAIEEAVPRDSVQGDRYSPEAMALVDRPA